MFNDLWNIYIYIYGLVQERRNSSALRMGYIFLALTHGYIMDKFQHQIVTHTIIH